MVAKKIIASTEPFQLVKSKGQFHIVQHGS